ncbi:FKBP-type peptidyl-prolyl cis-trans isomerase FkpA [Chitinophaga niastensis]|uniref:Peptidyl-prolyl cis-trans isomerase n=1 Tax=Chitinophaga niastensis TaxID=536980 RepID=A0A2P8HPF5_CHINA|nr:FKBP-type peptidyl-prolyl cis-trans isomerase [Chitinophaga niastensis]PSL48099.1 FKBP-type peptidyl-prolyl cis-trans isomerase FkpA [Chitinophaga niastensis]
MKKVFLLGGLFLVVLAACSKKDNTTPYDAVAQFNIDSAKIDTYLKANNITGVKHDSTYGIFYQIVKRGDTKDTAKATSNVKVGYIGTLLDKSKFDSNDSTTFDLNRVIQGWQIGIPKIGKGGEINLYLPSYYGYGPTSPGSGIPANAVLIFNVKLIDFTNK